MGFRGVGDSLSGTLLYEGPRVSELLELRAGVIITPELGKAVGLTIICCVMAEDKELRLTYVVSESFCM